MNRPPRVGIRALALLWAVLLGGATGAQQPTSSSSPYAPLLTREQAEALIEAWNDGSQYATGELIVKFKPGVTLEAQGRAVSVLRRRGPLEARWIGEALLVRADDEPDAEIAADIVRRQPEVEWVQANYLRRRRSRPNDPDYSRQWNLDQIGMPTAWDVNPGGDVSVRVAVVDSGTTSITQTLSLPLWTGSRFELVPVPVATPPDLPVARILPGRDFVFWNGPVVDFDGHGTAIAHAALGETNNSVGPAGIAYRTTLLPLKACVSYWDLQFLRAMFNIPGFVDQDEAGFCPDDLTSMAIRYAADNGARVINLSFGGTGQSPVLLDAIRYAVQRGAFIAMAIGNEFEEGNPVEYPAAYARDVNGAVSVGAVGRSRRRASYSNTGAHLELVAPGGDFGDGGLDGLVALHSLDFRDFPPRATRPRFDRYGTVLFEGTSFSTPHVAGAAALLYAQGITTPAAVETALEQSATDLGTAGRDNDFGFGLIDPRAALRGMGLAR